MDHNTACKNKEKKSEAGYCSEFKAKEFESQFTSTRLAPMTFDFLLGINFYDTIDTSPNAPFQAYVDKKI